MHSLKRARARARPMRGNSHLDKLLLDGKSSGTKRGGEEEGRSEIALDRRRWNRMGRHSSNAIFLKNSSSTGRNCDFKHRVAREGKKRKKERKRERRNFFSHCRPLPFLDPVLKFERPSNFCRLFRSSCFFPLVSFFLFLN